MAILTNRNRTRAYPDRRGSVLGAISEGEEWDYDGGREWRFSPIVIALSRTPSAADRPWGRSVRGRSGITIGEGNGDSHQS